MSKGLNKKIEQICLGKIDKPHYICTVILIYSAYKKNANSYALLY